MTVLIRKSWLKRCRHKPQKFSLQSTSRRKTIKQLGTGLATAGLFGFSATTFSCAGAKAAKKAAKTPFFKISLAQWSLHRSIFGDALKDYGAFAKALMTDPDSVLQGTINPIDYPAFAKKECGVDAVEFGMEWESINRYYHQ